MAPKEACSEGAMPHESKSIQPVPSSPSMRIMVSGANFGGAPQRERKEGEAPSLEDHLNHCGVGWFQFKIFVMAAAIVAADGMEMTVISLLRKPLSKEWELDDDTFSMLGSTVFLGLLIGNLIGGYLADIFGRKKCIIAITVVFCVFGVLSAIAPDVYIFAVSRFFTGVGVGSMVPVSDSHLLEWSPSAWRAKMAMTLTGVAFGLGAAFACVVGIVLQMTLPDDENWWRYMLFLCVLPGVGSLPFVALYFPESPHWLLVNEKDEELEQLLGKLASENGVDVLEDGKCAPCSADDEPTGSFLARQAWWHKYDVAGVSELFSQQLLSSTVFCTVVWVVCGFVYYGHIFIYPVLLEDVWKMTASEAYGTILISIVVELAVVMATMFVMDVPGIGRRGATAIGFLFTWIGSCLVPFTSTRAQFIGINCCIKSIVEGPFTLIYIYAGELYPSTHRGTAVAFCNSFGRIAAMMAPVLLMRVFKLGGGSDHPAGAMLWVYLLLGAFAFCGLVAAALFSRETLGKSLAVRTKDIDLEEDEPLIKSLGAQAVSFAQDQQQVLEKVAREGSENWQSSMMNMTQGLSKAPGGEQ